MATTKQPAQRKWWERPEWAGVLYACQACQVRFDLPPESGKCPRCGGDMTAHFPPRPVPVGVELRVCGNVISIEDGEPRFCESESDAGPAGCPDCRRPRARTLLVARPLNDEEQATIGQRNAARRVEFDRISKYEVA